MNMKMLENEEIKYNLLELKNRKMLLKLIEFCSTYEIKTFLNRYFLESMNTKIFLIFWKWKKFWNK